MGQNRGGGPHWGLARAEVGVCGLGLVPPLPLAREGGEVEIVFLAVFQCISVFAVCTRMCTSENTSLL